MIFETINFRPPPFTVKIFSVPPQFRANNFLTLAKFGKCPPPPPSPPKYAECHRVLIISDLRHAQMLENIGIIRCVDAGKYAAKSAFPQYRVFQRFWDKCLTIKFIDQKSFNAFNSNEESLF
jgi:hypothetical protein